MRNSIPEFEAPRLSGSNLLQDVSRILDRAWEDHESIQPLASIMNPNTWSQETLEQVLNYFSQSISSEINYPANASSAHIDKNIHIDGAKRLRKDPRQFLYGIISHLLVFEEPTLTSAQSFTWAAASKEFLTAIGLDQKLENLATETAENEIKNLGENWRLLCQELPKKTDREKFPEDTDEVLKARLVNYYRRSLSIISILIFRQATTLELETDFVLADLMRLGVKSDILRRIANHNILTRSLSTREEFPRDMIGTSADLADLVVPLSALDKLVDVILKHSDEMTKSN